MSETSSDSHSEVLSAGFPLRRARRIWVTASALTFAVLASFLFTRYSAYQKVQETFYGQALLPANDAFNFHLVDQDGKPFQLSQLHGKLVLFSFGFTHCPNVCPTTLSELAKIYRALPDKDRSKARVLFVSVDPRRDRPEALKSYIPYFDSSFVGLTGSDDRISEAAKAYGAFYEIVPSPGENSDVYSVNHSAFTYLISPDGKWKLIYNFDQLGDAEKIVGDIKRVLAGG